MRRLLGLLVVSVMAMGILASPSSAYADSCWGQATAAFAGMGEMGEHASQQATPRVGLRNLAQTLYEDGALEAPTVQALAAYLVSGDPDLTVEACMD